MRLKVSFNNPKWVTDYHKNFMPRQRTKYFKTCSKCGEVKNIRDFVKDRRYKDGLTNEAKIRSVIHEYFLAINDQNWSKAKNYCSYGSDKYYKTCTIEDAINTLNLYCNIVTVNCFVTISNVSIYGNYSDAYCYISVTISACGYFESDSAYGYLYLQKVGNGWKLY